MSGLHVARILPSLTIMTLGGTLLCSSSIALQPDAKILPPAKEAERVRVTEGPAIESAKRNFIIIKWTSNNPGGTYEHFRVVPSGTNPQHLMHTPQPPVSSNQNHHRP